MARFLFSFCFFSFLVSCGTGGSRIFNKKTPHEQYGNKLEEAGLKDTELGRRWFEAAAAALSRPVTVKLPYSQRGYFSADNPRAIGLQFNAIRGEKLFVRVNIKSAGRIKVYTDLYKV